MPQDDLRALRVRQKRRSYTRLFAALGFVLVLALGGGAYAYLSAPDEPPAAPSAAAPVKTSAQKQTTPAPVENKAAAEPLKEAAEDAPAATSKSVVAAPTGTSILIRKSEFRLYLLEDGKVVNAWPVALGKNAGQKRVSGDMKTPDGSFPIDEVLDSSYWTHDFHDGKGEIEGAYGPYFISLDTSDLSGGAWDGIGIHGTHDLASIGTRASEGCIRMNNSDLLALKEQITVGTQVTIEE